MPHNHHHHHDTPPSFPSSDNHRHHNQQPPPSSRNHHRHANEPSRPPSFNDLNLTPPPSHNHHHQPPSSSHNHHRHGNESSRPPTSFHDLNLTPPPSHNNHHHRNQQYYRPYNTTSSSSSASIRGCCCCLILLFSFLALLVLTVVLVIVLAVKPKKPEFNLQQVGVQYINLAGVTAANTASLSLAIRMLFTAKNDNKVGIKYGVSTFNIMYRGIPLGRGTVPGFYQPAHSVRQVQTTVTVDRVNLLQQDAADLLRDATTNDRVELRIMGDVNAKIRILGLTSPAVQASVDCAIAISLTKQALTYKQCGFEGLQV